MALEKKDLLDFLGIKDEGIETIEDFKGKFSGSFIRKDLETIRGDEIFGKLIGLKLGGTYTALKRALKKAGVDFNEDDYKGKDVKLEEVVETNIDKLIGKYSTEIQTLKEAAGKGNDQKVIDLEKAVSELKTEKEKIAGEKTTLATEFETFKTTKEKEARASKLNSEKEKVWKDFKWANGVDDLRKEGFQSRIEKKFKFDFDDKGEFAVMDSEGKKIPNPKKADTFKTPADILLEEGAEAKVYAISQQPAAKTPAAKVPATPVEGAPPADPRRKINTALRPA